MVAGAPDGAPGDGRGARSGTFLQRSTLPWTACELSLPNYRAESLDRHRRLPVALDAVGAEADLEDTGAPGRGARGEDEVAERPGDEGVPARPDGRPEDVGMRAEHERRAGAKARDRQRLLALVGLGVQLDAPVEEAD